MSSSHSSSRPQPRDVCIVAMIRTPLCRARKGGLATVPPSTLLATTLTAVLRQASLAPGDVGDVCVGNVLSPASGAAAMRMAMFQAGMVDSTPLSVCNRQCSSGLQAVSNIANAIAVGDIEIGIGCGVESMSFHPMNKIPLPDVDFAVMTATPGAMDCLIPMGVTSENVANKYGLTRTELDAFAARSHQRAQAAQSAGRFRPEIVAVVTPDGTTVDHDDGIRADTTPASLARLKPVFDPEHGSTTAGNASQMTDGAAAVLLMSRREAERRNLPVVAVWRSFDCVGVPPAIMGVGPAVAIPRALRKIHMTVRDVDLFEINEAFASQALWCVRELKVPQDMVNVNGGAIALGHPLGCTGARQIVTLLHEMHRRKGSKFGVVSMCIGTGMGAAAVLELENGSVLSSL